MNRLALLLVILCACSDDGVSSSAEGIYSVSSWTENEAGCEAEGESVLEDQLSDHVLVQVIEFFGIPFLQASLCSLEECREDQGNNTIQLGNSFAFESGSDSSGWKGSGYAISGSETCSGEVWTDTLLVDGDQITIERRAVLVENVPLDEEDFCDGEAAEAMAEALPCTRLEVIKAGYQEG